MRLPIDMSRLQFLAVAGAEPPEEVRAGYATARKQETRVLDGGTST